ncbi:class I SAM-dependent methyltransferase [Glycomyces sp. YM15]|uniref:class I SAM-dependent methyltransferase n=1 Tax=Glycomyces sp. YM15 TaxID=2800446 RepID=UPI001963C5C6|nr:class I SAM-dependent methyltransferase [Glycomyces sp. YM15]
MAHDFDKDYWERHWEQHRRTAPAEDIGSAPHPYLGRETAGLTPGTALDAGCGSGAEAIWLATRGWHVTAADIAARALARDAEDAANASLSGSVRWVEADLTIWEPGRRFDLVATSYAHPAMPQAAFYRRIAAWVAPGGTLLIVGHLHEPDSTGNAGPPAEAGTTLADITSELDPTTWRIETAAEHSREFARGGRAVALHDVVVRATRLV